jgi:cytochrome c biogenesis protein
MSSTSGFQLKTRRRFLAEAVELVSSMRFAIALLTLIAIAATIGTVLKQNEPMPNYVNQFGPFWFEIFSKLSLYAIYSSWWFLLIMAFLVVSTTLCLVRNTPKMIRDMRSWREHVREVSLRNFHHKAEWVAPLTRAALAAQSARRLELAGYKARLVEKDGAILVAARKGAGTRFGYIFAHSAIVIICIGGLLDSDLPIRFQQWAFGKTPFGGSGLISDIPEQHRLGLGNPTYRGNTLIAEGQSTDVALIPQASGVMVQPLPFTITLKKFHIDFYSTGMPKLFASDVVVRDHASGKTVAATIKVNEPLIYQGIALYQSSFEDGGTKLKLTGYPMTGASDKAFALDGEVNGESPLAAAGEQFTVEWSGFRPFNVENVGSNDARSVAQGQSLNEQLLQGLDKHSGSAAKGANTKDLKNVGPSLTYKLRDKAGQAREYQNYMQPVTIDGASVYLSGMRASPNEPFSFLRIPADEAHSVKEWMRLRAALADPALRARAAERYVTRALAGSTNPGLADQLRQSAAKGLEVFAGAAKGAAGYVAVSAFLERLPRDQQENAAGVFMKLLQGSMWELWQAAREQAGDPVLEPTDARGRWLQMATNAISDSFFYGAPVYLQLDEFVEVKASVLQVTRSPGKSVVYLGCLLLVLGVFAMFYIRERRVWVWVRDEGDGAHALMAMSTQRKTLDFEHEFNDLKTRLPQSA